MIELAKFIEEHKKIHEEWSKEPSQKLYSLHDNVVKILEELNWKHTTPLKFEQKEVKGKIIFYGTRGLVEEKDDYHKHHTMIGFYSDYKPFIIDAGESWNEVSVDKRPDRDNFPILITHSHPDHLGGLRNLDLTNRKIYVSRRFIESELWKEEKDKGYKGFSPIVFENKQPFVLEGRKAVAIPVLHSLKAPSVSVVFEFCGKKIFHGNDVLSISKRDREEYLKDCDVYIGDASSLRKTLIKFRSKEEGAKGKPFGHSSVMNQLRWARDANVKCCIFTHLGKEPIEMDEDDLNREVETIAKNVGYKGQVYIARDGAYLKLPEMEFVTEPERITEIQDLKNYDPAKIKDTKVLLDDHRILLAWWANYYAPNAPKKGEEFKYSSQLILDKATELTKELIRRGIKFSLPKDYSPGARDLFLKVIQKVGLANFKWKESVSILEFKEQNLPGLYLIEPHALKLWAGEKTLIVKARPFRKYANKKLFLLGDKAYGIGVLSEPKGPYDAQEVLFGMKSKHLITPEEFNQWWKNTKTVYLYTWKWIEKFEKPKSYVRVQGTQTFVRNVKLLETITEAEADSLIKKYVDSSKWEKMKADDRIELLKKRQFLEPPYPYLPPKSIKGAYRELELFDKPSVVNLARDWFKEYPGQFIYVETKFAGMSCMGMKKGEEIRMWSESGERIDDVLPTLREELKKIPADSFILQSELMAYDEKGNALPYRMVVKAMGKEEIDDSHWIAHVYDLGYLNGKDLHKEPYEERRRLLRGLELPRGDVPKRWNWHWVENIPLEARTEKEVIQAVKTVSKIPYSEGAMLKLSGGEMTLNGRTPYVAKYKLFYDIDVLVAHLFPKIYTKGPKKGQMIPGQNNLACLIGPVEPPKDAVVYDLEELWKEERNLDHYKEFKTHKIQYVRYKKKVYSNIGITFSTAEEVHVGDIVRVQVQLMRKVSDTDYRWTIPKVLEPRPEKTEPDPVSVADNIYKSVTLKLEMILEESAVGEEGYDLEEFSSKLKDHHFHKKLIEKLSEKIIEEGSLKCLGGHN